MLFQSTRNPQDILNYLQLSFMENHFDKDTFIRYLNGGEYMLIQEKMKQKEHFSESEKLISEYFIKH